MIIQGITAILNPFTIGLIFIGVVIGIIFGSIPGLSATMALVLFLPMSFGLEPINGISLLVGLYLGGISGGLISAILLKIPGTPSSIATVFDGGPLANQGKAGYALGAAILASFFGGLISIFALMFISPALAKVTLKFTSAEYFAIAVFSLTIIASLSGKSLLNGLIAGLLGFAISLVGVAPVDGFSRFTFGSSELYARFDITVLLIGVFAVTEIIQRGFYPKTGTEQFQKVKYDIQGFGITFQEFFQHWVNILRSSLIGLGIGILPGIGGSTASLFAYTAAKNSSKYPEKFGTGVIDGVIASESSNNAVIGGSLIPLITMGIPGNAATAIFLGGLTIHGIVPGPLIFKNSGQYMYGMFFALILANFFMLLAERVGLRYFVKVLDIPKNILLPIVMVFCMLGAYYSNFRVFDVVCVFAFGLLGTIFSKFAIPTSPFIIGYILGGIAEVNLRQALMQSGGNWSIFVTRPISLIFLLIAAFSVVSAIYKNMKSKKLSC